MMAGCSICTTTTLPKTTVAEIARPGSRVEVGVDAMRDVGVCVHGRFTPHKVGFAWNQLALLIIFGRVMGMHGRLEQKALITIAVKWKKEALG